MSSTRTTTGPARAIRLLLGAQVMLAVLLAGGDLLDVLPEILRSGPNAPPLTAPINPGDQTRRYDPRLSPEDMPSGPGFPGGPPPSRLTWESRQIGDAPGLLVTGTIAPGDAARLIDYLSSTDAPETVSLHSPGGSVADALDIGRHLRSSGMNTHLSPGAACFSACPYILASGVERRISTSAMVGVHQHYFGQSTVLPAFLAVKDIQRGQAEVMAYLNGMGIDLMVMEKAMQTPPEDIYVLLPDELQGFNFATDLVD